MDCCQRPLDQIFDERTAKGDLRRFRKKGPDKPTALLIDAVASRIFPPHPTLLDVGGGIGAIHHVLLNRGFAEAVHVDFSAPYLQTAQAESARVGHGGRVEFRYGAFAEIAGSIAQADVVTLDRVVCCDPDYERLLGAAAARARHLLGFSYPRERWIIRAVMAFGNWGGRFGAIRFVPSRIRRTRWSAWSRMPDSNGNGPAGPGCGGWWYSNAPRRLATSSLKVCSGLVRLPTLSHRLVSK